VRASEEVVTHNKGTAVNTGLVINESKSKHIKIFKKFSGSSVNQQTSI
jgi:hypothetical protein